MNNQLTPVYIIRRHFVLYHSKEIHQPPGIIFGLRIPIMGPHIEKEMR